MVVALHEGKNNNGWAIPKGIMASSRRHVRPSAFDYLRSQPSFWWLQLATVLTHTAALVIHSYQRVRYASSFASQDNV